jgi:ABC-type glycerol-3-phosphate transport system substrate-binding protein
MTTSAARSPCTARNSRAATAVLAPMTTGAAACGAGTAGTASSAKGGRLGPTGFTFKEPVAITYWLSLGGASEQAQVKLTKEFHAKRGDVRVTMENVGGYEPA